MSMVDSTMILPGAIPAAVLALLLDGLLAGLEHALKRGRSLRPVVLAAAAIAAALLVALVLPARTGPDQPIGVGSKNFTEQVLLGELLALTLESEGASVERRLNLGGTFICDRALRSGDIDVYVEYSGTALTAVFKRPVEGDADVVNDSVRRLYADVGVTMLPPLGFDNTFAILVRGADARARGLVRLSQLSAHAPG